jgi:NAD-dependent deacetylase
VHPVAGLPEETLAAGGLLAIVNKGPTPYDERAELKLEGNAAEILGAVVERLA